MILSIVVAIALDGAIGRGNDLLWHLPTDLKRFNPWLRDSKLISNGRSYTILIPRKQDLYYTSPNRTVYDQRWVTK